MNDASSNRQYAIKDVESITTDYKDQTQIIKLRNGETIVNALNDISNVAFAITSFDTPKYEAISGKYIVTDSGSEYESIELGASGTYIITMRNSHFYAPMRIENNKSFLHACRMFDKHSHISRGTDYNGLIYGTYTIMDDERIMLDDFGILEIVYDEDGIEVVGLVLTPTGNSTVQFGVKKEDGIDDDELSTALCRTWLVESMREIYREGGIVIEDITYTLDDYYQGEDYDEDEGFPTEVLFSKSGTYMVYYSDGTIGVSSWKWKNKEDRTIYYAWENYWSEEAWCTLIFTDNKLIVYEYYDDGYYKDEGYTTLVPKK